MAPGEGFSPYGRCTGFISRFAQAGSLRFIQPFRILPARRIVDVLPVACKQKHPWRGVFVLGSGRRIRSQIISSPALRNFRDPGSLLAFTKARPRVARCAPPFSSFSNSGKRKNAHKDVFSFTAPGEGFEPSTNRLHFVFYC